MKKQKAFPSREITIDNIADIEKVKDFKSAIYIIREIGGNPLKHLMILSPLERRRG